jgi:hypothetical protein
MNKMINITKKVSVLLGIFILVVVAGLIFWYVLEFSKPKLTLSTQVYKMDASKTEQGTGMSFVLPQGFTEVDGDSAYTKVFVQKDSSNKTVRSITAIRRLSNGQSPLLTQVDALKGFNNLVSHISSVIYYDKKSPNFQKFDIKSSLAGANTKEVSSQIGIKVLPEINEDFQLKVTGSSPAEVDASLKYKFSDKSAYYLIVSSTSETWQKDQAIWKQVLSGLKVDL